MNSYFMGYPTFTEIRNPTLRAYNRANMFLNIRERHGSIPAQRYVKKMGKNEMFSIFTMMRRFHDDGFENTRRSLIRNREI